MSAVVSVASKPSIVLWMDRTFRRLLVDPPDKYGVDRIRMIIDKTLDTPLPTPRCSFTVQVRSPPSAPPSAASSSAVGVLKPFTRDTEYNAAPIVKDPSTVRSGKPAIRISVKTPSTTNSSPVELKSTESKIKNRLTPMPISSLITGDDLGPIVF